MAEVNETRAAASSGGADATTDADVEFLRNYAAALRHKADAGRKAKRVFGPECIDVQAPIFERIAARLSTLSAQGDAAGPTREEEGRDSFGCMVCYPRLCHCPLPSAPVHNHGTEDGPGLACRERRVDGRLVGDCLSMAPEPDATEAIARSAIEIIQECRTALGLSKGRSLTAAVQKLYDDYLIARATIAARDVWISAQRAKHAAALHRDRNRTATAGSGVNQEVGTFGP